MVHLLRILFLLCTIVLCNAYSDSKQRRFADSFQFGVATSAYQVEGAWDSDGKGESIWDHFTHSNPEVVSDGTLADEAADSYHNYKRDVEMLRELGVDFYRFSIAWSRVLPDGHVNEINVPGMQYYTNLLKELKQNNIESMVTMYHFDLPQALQDLGGWTNPLSVDWFEDYARLLFDKYGKSVKYWITFNQPDSICLDGYGRGTMAPGVQLPGVADYMCIKNILLANARVWRLYDKEYRHKYKGSIGIALAVNWLDSAKNTTEHRDATEEYRDFTIGLYMDPIFSETGDFPLSVKAKIAKNSREQGFEKSRLPALSSEEKSYIKGTADFLAMNHYTTMLVKRANGEDFDIPSFDHDANVKLSYGKKWKQGKSAWLKSAPYGIYKACLYLNKKYNYPPIIITENGWSTDKGLMDKDRVEYFREYLFAVQLAIEDGTDIKGYTAWSLMDNFEWTAGHSERFGLYEVDFTSPNKTRTARKSALAYKNIIESRVIDATYDPTSLQITKSSRRVLDKVVIIFNRLKHKEKVLSSVVCSIIIFMLVILPKHLSTLAKYFNDMMGFMQT